MLENTIRETEMQSQANSDGSCAGCQARQEQASKNEELSFAFLLALVPALTLSLFGNIGLL